jgi:MFS family permease
MRCPTAPAAPQGIPVAAPSGRLQQLATAAFINRRFALLWTGRAISSVGDFAFDTALVLWIGTFLAAHQSWAPLAVSGALLAAALPQIVAGPIAGVFVDRWDKRRTMLWMIALQAVVAALLAPLAGHVAVPFVAGGHLAIAWPLGFIYADVAVLSICAQFVGPAQLALVKDIVPEAKQDQALETSQAMQGLAVILGPRRSAPRWSSAWGPSRARSW